MLSAVFCLLAHCSGAALNAVTPRRRMRNGPCLVALSGPSCPAKPLKMSSLPRASDSRKHASRTCEPTGLNPSCAHRPLSLPMNSRLSFCFCAGAPRNASTAREPALSWHTLRTSMSVMETMLSENIGTQSPWNLNNVWNIALPSTEHRP